MSIECDFWVLLGTDSRVPFVGVGPINAEPCKFTFFFSITEHHREFYLLFLFQLLFFKSCLLICDFFTLMIKIFVASGGCLARD